MNFIHLLAEESDFAFLTHSPQPVAAFVAEQAMARVESRGRYGRSPEGNNVEEFRRRLSGTIVRPGDAEYDTARAVWNGMIDRRPAIIAYCTNVNDVIQSIAFGRETGILTSVRSGGHNIAGSSLCD